MAEAPGADQGAVFIRELGARNLLSFRELDLPLGPLNVLIGANGSGKSNLLELLALLQAAPRDIGEPIRRGGGIIEWLRKAGDRGSRRGSLAVVAAPPWRHEQPDTPWLRYELELGAQRERHVLLREWLGNDRPLPGYDSSFVYFDVHDGLGVIGVRQVDAAEESEGDRPKRRLERDTLTPGQSVLRERKDPDIYPEVTYLADRFSALRLYTEWNLGRHTAARDPQLADLPTDVLLESTSNLALVLSRLKLRSAADDIEREFARFFPWCKGLDFDVGGGRIQLYMREEGLTDPVPATRMSDGMLRYLCLLAVLCHPSPPPLLCIEEPELGLHPDIMAPLARLLKQASTRTQLIITTHSPELVDQFSDMPEAVVVCERGPDGASEMRRLDADRLAKWLERYRLGELWGSGQIGGTRW